MWEFLYHRLTYPEECRQTKQWFSHISKRRSMRILKCTRLQWGKLVQLMTGHNFLARHNYVVDNDLDPHCPLCTLDYIQDSCHFFAECPIFLDIRLTLFKHRVLEPPFDDLPISDVLKFLLQSGSEALAWVAQGVEQMHLDFFCGLFLGNDAEPQYSKDGDGTSTFGTEVTQDERRKLTLFLAQFAIYILLWYIWQGVKLGLNVRKLKNRKSKHCNLSLFFPFLYFYLYN